ncbi:MAG TPA: hypothetical protein GXX77_04115 [Candidatus Cloacimonetes bacterium]|nr:hypothetical protein [Candidatus Cloacimonadota bacterium]
MYPIFGYGSPRFYIDEELCVHFDERQAAGAVVLEPIEELIETLGGDLIQNFKGYRAEVSLKLYNTRNRDIDQHLMMLRIINRSREMGDEILLQPRFQDGRTLDLMVYPKGDLGYKEITNLNAGQDVELSFVSVRLIKNFPLVSSRPRFLKIGKGSFLVLKNKQRMIV